MVAWDVGFIKFELQEKMVKCEYEKAVVSFIKEYFEPLNIVVFHY